MRRGGVCANSKYSVFIEYPLNLDFGCISMFAVNLTFDKTLIMHFLLFFPAKIATFWAINALSIQNST